MMTIKQLLGLLALALLIDAVQAVAPWSVGDYPNPTTVCTIYWPGVLPDV